MKQYLIGFITIFIAALILVSPVLGQSTMDNPTQDPRYKDQDISLILGIVIVGGGHFYSGDTGTGAILLGTAIGAPLIGSIVATNNVDNAVQSGNASSITGPVYAGLAISLGAWIYSIVDAPKAARRTNVKNGLAWNDDIQIAPSLLATNTNKMGYGIKMRINF